MHARCRAPGLALLDWLPGGGVLRWDGLFRRRGDAVSLYSVADGGGLLLLPIAGRVPWPRGGMPRLPRPAPLPRSPPPPHGTLRSRSGTSSLQLGGGTQGGAMSPRSLSLPSLKWGSVSWTWGFAWGTRSSLCLAGVAGKTAAGIFPSCESLNFPAPVSGGLPVCCN